jgi:streptomycin 6-kinase
LLARLVAVPAPTDLRQLADIAAAMLEQVPRSVHVLREAAEQRLVRACASAVSELISEPGDRLLHWDLHYENVLAGERGPWLAIDPKPYVGDPTYDVLQHLLNCDARLHADPRRLARQLAGLLELDANRVLQWLFARCVIESVGWSGLADIARRLAPS